MQGTHQSRKSSKYRCLKISNIPFVIDEKRRCIAHYDTPSPARQKGLSRCAPRSNRPCRRQPGKEPAPPHKAGSPRGSTPLCQYASSGSRLPPGRPSGLRPNPNRWSGCLPGNQRSCPTPVGWPHRSRCTSEIHRCPHPPGRCHSPSPRPGRCLG